MNSTFSRVRVSIIWETWLIYLHRWGEQNIDRHIYKKKVELKAKLLYWSTLDWTDAYFISCQYVDVIILYLLLSIVFLWNLTYLGGTVTLLQLHIEKQKGKCVENVSSCGKSKTEHEEHNLHACWNHCHHFLPKLYNYSNIASCLLSFKCLFKPLKRFYVFLNH